MKRAFTALLTFIMVFSLILVACDSNNTSDESSTDASTAQSQLEESLPAEESEVSQEMKQPDANALHVWNDSYADEKSGIASANDVYSLKYYFDGELINDYSVEPASGDGKYIFGGEQSSRFVNVSEGYMLTLPSSEVNGNFTLAEFRVQLETDMSVVTISTENQNPYGNTQKGWQIYLDEWIKMRFDDINFLSENNIMRTRKNQIYTDVIEGYEILTYSLFIKLSKEIERPHYNIAIIRKNNDYINFYLVVMKSKENCNESFDTMLSTFRFFKPEGKVNNHIKQRQVIVPEHWNNETKAYYDKLRNQKDVDWGFFYSRNSQEYIDWMKSDDGIGYTPEVFMTYLHIGWYNTKNHLDLDFVNKNAGGNGFDGKPVLNLTYQFTTTNNSIAGYTPMFDIMRGKMDSHFERLADDIKEYGKPVLFRLNNEMNTDWTSYAGIVTLLDPDIYVMCWQRLYDIFVEKGVDNCIFVFNPLTTTCPYCDWGEALCYYPGDEYCQMLGLTHYIDANTTPIESFKEGYTKTYNKFKDYFIDFPWMIGEFACGAGGSKLFDWGINAYVDKVQGRSESAQASWCAQMFTCFANNQAKANEFCKNIKVAVWFSCNDYCSIDGKDYIVNYYELDEALDQTLEVFKKWLPKLHPEE